MPTRRVIVLGSTGSIGTQTLDVLAHLNALHDAGVHQDRYEVVGLSAGRNADLLGRQASLWKPAATALLEPAPLPHGVRGFVGPEAPERLVRELPCDLIVAGIVGSAGLAPTLAAVELGRDVALANKETLVAAGSLIVPLAERTGSRLLPVDSEHSGVWQALSPRVADRSPPMRLGAEVARVTLTASGGALRDLPLEDLQHASVERVLQHPTWAMGPKVTVDSASLMNKCLELIEASWLFGLPADRLGAVIHPQSIVHALVEYADGSVVAQLGAPDMRTPIQVALAWPLRPPGLAPRLDPATLGSLRFVPADPARYPALDLADRALRDRGNAGAILNAANEQAVELFLTGRCGFGSIVPAVRRAMDDLGVSPLRDLADAKRSEREARRSVRLFLGAEA